ncbi:hypothetical protein NRIC_33820 [Enterococcus florum]|uniref:PTS EIIA type-1 domain-containing protein n=1 Tax=Enterococcus florum TaxID=2480627 RepID=A0A4P5PGD6_9ENTE|nr:hypothetical protein NRIC_33820 [Enterococcus florum]
MNAIEGYAGWVVPTLTGAIFPLMVTAGMHYGLVPFMMQSIASNGYETIAGPGNLPSNIAQGAASLAVAFKTKNQALKKTAVTTGVTALLGVTEPALFAVTLKYKKVLTSVMIGGGLGGLYAGITGVKSFSFSSPGLLALVAYVGPDGWTNVINASISMVIGFIATFIAVWVWGYKDVLAADQEVAVSSQSKDEVASPMDGVIMPLSEVPDETFSTGMLGQGFAVMPTNGMVVSPVSGKVLNIFPSKHAIGLMSNAGVEILVHIGLDTVNLNGVAFETIVSSGDVVSVGDPLVSCDLNRIQSEGYNSVTMVIITNSTEFEEFNFEKLGSSVKRGDKVLEVTKEKVSGMNGTSNVEPAVS